jgi:hypothetical protein
MTPKRLRLRLVGLALGVAVAGSAAACGSSEGSAEGPPGAVPVESNPPGDIPDDVAFVPYTNAAAGYSFTHPEGWAEQEAGSAVTFTDKLNGVSADTEQLPTALDEATVRAQEVPRLTAGEEVFELVSVTTDTLPAGPEVVVVYRRNSPPDPVTGRRVRDEVEEHLVSNGTSSVRLALFGPEGADNVDAYRTISQSLTLR